MFIGTAYAQGAGAPGGGGDFISMMLPLVLIFVVFYFLLIRPQQKRMKEHRTKIDAVRRGDKVVTGGGIVGTISKVEDQEVLVEIAENVRVRVMKATITDVLAKAEPADGEKAEPAEKPKAEGGLLGRFSKK
jgi:preprotein translocase subunit YajC